MLVAHVWRTGMQSPIESECKIPISTWCRERFNDVFADITKSPILYNQGLMGSISP